MPNFENLFQKPATTSTGLELARAALSSESLALQQNAAFRTLQTPGELKSPEVLMAETVNKLAASKLAEIQNPPAVTEKIEPPRYFETVSQIGAFGGALAIKYNPYVGAGLIAGAGAYQGYQDFCQMSKANTIAQRAKFTMALGADAGMIAGGVLTVAKYGPRWLAPVLIGGGFAGRLALDLIPDKNKK